MSDNIGTFLAGFLVRGGSLPGQAARILRAFRRAHAREPEIRTDSGLRHALIDESAEGAYDEPETGRLAWVYEAWRSGIEPKEFARQLRGSTRIRLRRRV